MTAIHVSDSYRADVAHRAKSQVGSLYEFGQAGPHAFDCSGSVVAAWRPYLALPHNSGELIRWIEADPASQLLRPGTVKRHAARTYLQPGDLVFYYGDPGQPETVSHVAVYVGADYGVRMVVNATDEARGVELIRMFAYARPCAYGLVGHRVP